MPGLITHDWIERHGGSENVVDQLILAYPDADLSCLWTNAPERYPATQVNESWMARTPLRRSKAASLPLMSRTWRSVDTADYDWVLASSHAFSHHVGSKRGTRATPTFVYTHTPPRYLWAPELDPRGSNSVARALAPALRRIDRAHAGGADYAANSAFVADRIKNAWGLEARVIHPPSDVTRLQGTPDWSSALSPQDADVFAELPPTYLAGASRFVGYKLLDAVIAFGEAVGVPVVLAGGGPEEESLRARAAEASVPVHFVVAPSNELLYAVLQGAMAYVFPPVEDFGIMPVEATALGTPVIAHTVGGASESLDITRGGAVHDFARAGGEKESLQSALAVDVAQAALNARHFSNEEFRKKIQNWVTPH